MGEEEEQIGPEIRDIPGLPKEEEAALNAGSKSQSDALKEASQLSSGKSSEDLKKEAERREHERNQGFRDHFEKLIYWGMNGAFLAVMLLGGAWIWHLVAPQCWQWMDGPQIDHIQNMVTGGVIAVVVGDHFKRRLG